MSQEKNHGTFAHQPPSFMRSVIEDARNQRFVSKYDLEQGVTESRPNELSDETKNMTVWLSNINRLIGHCPPPQSGARFIDIGSGAGIACIYTALSFPFSEVIGVEHDPRHLATARRNQRKMGCAQQMAKMSFIQADASSYRFPPDVNYVFLFNPFSEKTFEKMMNLNCGDLASHRTYLLLANDHLVGRALRYGELLWRDTKLNLSVVRVS